MISDHTRKERFEKGISILETWDPKTNTVAINGERAYFAMNLFASELNEDGRITVIDSYECEAVDFGDHFSGSGLPEDVLPAPIPDFCNSAGCALGTFGLNPWFRRRGLCSNPEDNEVIYKMDGYEYDDYEAAEYFFGITYSEANYIFGPNYDQGLHKVTPLDVAERMREVLGRYT